jgi:hypothetical protein
MDAIYHQINYIKQLCNSMKKILIFFVLLWKFSISIAGTTSGSPTNSLVSGISVFRLSFAGVQQLNIGIQ